MEAEEQNMAEGGSRSIGREGVDTVVGGCAEGRKARWVEASVKSQLLLKRWVRQTPVRAQQGISSSAAARSPQPMAGPLYSCSAILAVRCSEA